MQKFTILLTLIFTLAFTIACGPQVDDIASDSAETASSPSGTDVDVQLGIDETAAEAEEAAQSEAAAAVEDAIAQIEAEPVQPPAPAELQPPSDALISLLPGYDEGDIQETANGLMYIIYEEGSGDAPQPGDTVIAHYTGYTADGNKFDSSRDREQTFNFPIGQGRVIRGWDEGFALMNPGTKALLIIPSELGYGAQGAGADIPPNATLYFDVELVDVEPVRRPMEIDPSDFTELESGIRYSDMTIGSGDKAVDGKVVSMNFALWEALSGELFASSDEAGNPLGFKLGSEQMFAALQDGVRGMQIGGSRQIYMPAAAIEGANFPPGTDILFEVELVDITEGSPDNPTEVADAAFIDTESGVRYADIVTGDRKPLVPGDFVTLHYTAWLVDGTLFDSSIDRNQPLEFPYSSAQIPGFNEGLVDITGGTVRQIIVPADVVGDLGLGEPSDVIFEVEIINP